MLYVAVLLINFFPKSLTQFYSFRKLSIAASAAGFKFLFKNPLAEIVTFIIWNVYTLLHWWFHCADLPIIHLKGMNVNLFYFEVCPKNIKCVHMLWRQVVPTSRGWLWNQEVEVDPVPVTAPSSQAGWCDWFNRDSSLSRSQCRHRGSLIGSGLSVRFAAFLNFV